MLNALEAAGENTKSVYGERIGLQRTAGGAMKKNTVFMSKVLAYLEREHGKTVLFPDREMNIKQSNPIFELNRPLIERIRSYKEDVPTDFSNN